MFFFGRFGFGFVGLGELFEQFFSLDQFLLRLQRLGLRRGLGPLGARQLGFGLVFFQLLCSGLRGFGTLGTGQLGLGLRLFQSLSASQLGFGLFFLGQLSSDLSLFQTLGAGQFSFGLLFLHLLGPGLCRLGTIKFGLLSFAQYGLGIFVSSVPAFVRRMRVRSVIRQFDSFDPLQRLHDDRAGHGFVGSFCMGIGRLHSHRRQRL